MINQESFLLGVFFLSTLTFSVSTFAGTFDTKDSNKDYSVTSNMGNGGTLVAEDSCKKVSSNPKDWYHYKVGPELHSILSRKITLTSYIFNNAAATGRACRSNCAIKLPSFNGSVSSVNEVLRYIGLPEISDLNLGGKKYYSTSDYPLGELKIYVGRYPTEEEKCSRHIWKVSISREN